MVAAIGLGMGVVLVGTKIVVRMHRIETPGLIDITATDSFIADVVIGSR